jgi:hypothetical protein
MNFRLDLAPLDLAPLDLPGLEDEVRAWFTRVRPELEDAFERSDLADLFDAGCFQAALERNGLAGLDEQTLGSLDDLASLAGRFPDALAAPDATGEVPTGGAGDAPGFAREELAVAASLSATPRIVTALGPQAETITVRGEAFTVATRYDDPETGFSALRLTPVEGGAEVFAIDGLQVGSRVDEVAAATLGRLQVESDVFRAMIEDAAAFGADGEAVLFVGPSLGGAVAQVAAYETAEALLATGANPAFGAVLDPAVLAVIEALNLRTEGDIISRIGSHLGPTLTLPGRDATGEVVPLTPAEAHVNAVSLLQTLSDDAFFATGVVGAPAEISGFAAASNETADEAIALWRALGMPDEATLASLQIIGTPTLDASRTVWSLDADDDGGVDIAVALSSPLDLARDDLVLV